MPRLYVVATPIGNLGDLSPRAQETLRSAALIAAEDTRVTGQLLAKFDIHTPCVSNHRHNEEGRAAPLVQRMLTENIDVALVTDAGTPAISDPGSFLVAEAAAAGIEVLAVPGPTAMASALSVSGFDTREFAFYGFLPRKRGDLKKKLLDIAASGVPIAVVHESPHRVIDLMEAVCEALPGCRVSASCDLTKLYEKTVRGSCEDVLAALRDNEKTDKGEYCLVLDLHDVTPPERTQQAGDAEDAPLRLLAFMLDGHTLEEASAALAEAGTKRNVIYRARERVRGFLMEQFDALAEEDEV